MARLLTMDVKVISQADDLLHQVRWYIGNTFGWLFCLEKSQDGKFNPDLLTYEGHVSSVDYNLLIADTDIYDGGATVEDVDFLLYFVGDDEPRHFSYAEMESLIKNKYFIRKSGKEQYTFFVK